MAKQGMKRVERTHIKPKNDAEPVPEIQGKAKHTKKKANSTIEAAESFPQKVYHSKPHSKKGTISSSYSPYDTDLAKDNLENDLSAADLQDL
ncbi:MAG: hypothetical protein UIL37_01050 [Clostridia bacterium]|nr:hypothetical protein [Clostridia bacterium]